MIHHSGIKNITSVLLIKCVDLLLAEFSIYTSQDSNYGIQTLENFSRNVSYRKEQNLTFA